jgi:protein required for attachment to host cells
MGTTWILTANRSRARLFEVVAHSDTPVELADFANPAGRAHEHDLRTDASGRFSGQGAAGGSAGALDDGIGAHETERFAESLREHLEQARGANRFGQLWIAAAPAFLGILRRNFPKELRERIELELDKDLTTEAPRELFRHLLAARPAASGPGS